MQLEEIDTIQDLKVWVKENMQGSIVEEGEGGIIIRTNLISTMGGYLHEKDDLDPALNCECGYGH